MPWGGFDTGCTHTNVQVHTDIVDGARLYYTIHTVGTHTHYSWLATSGRSISCLVPKSRQIYLVHITCSCANDFHIIQSRKTEGRDSFMNVYANSIWVGNCTSLQNMLGCLLLLVLELPTKHLELKVHKYQYIDADHLQCVDRAQCLGMMSVTEINVLYLDSPAFLGNFTHVHAMCSRHTSLWLRQSTCCR